jgi:hypothetical protein
VYQLKKYITMKQAPIQYSRLIAIGLFIASVSLFSGCKNTTREAESETTAPAIAEPEGEEVIRELSGYPIPNSYELTERIYEAGAKYNLHISNGPEKAGDYITQRDKVLNLGRICSRFVLCHHLYDEAGYPGLSGGFKNPD